jgi:hypothetical protein
MYERMPLAYCVALCRIVARCVALCRIVFCGCATCAVKVKELHRLRNIREEDDILILGEVTRNWGTLRNENFHDFYSLPYIISVIFSLQSYSKNPLLLWNTRVYCHNKSSS